jgi:hypothetical protein
MRRLAIGVCLPVSLVLTALAAILVAPQWAAFGPGPNEEALSEVETPPAWPPAVPPPRASAEPPPPSRSAEPPLPSAPDLPDPFEEQRIATEQHLRATPARYNVPEFLTYGRSTEISFVLEPEGSGTGADPLEGLPGRVVTATVKVSPQVNALLTGPADLVEIKPRGGDDAQRKAVTLTAPVQWVWDVKAIGDGTAVLQLELIAFIPNKDKETSFQVSTFRRQIPIQISGVDQAKRFIADLNPLWAFLTAVIAGLGSLLAYFGWKPSFGRSHQKNA